MQVAIEQRGCETSGNFAKTKHFSIKHSPKMFKMLSDGVYQDKLKAWNGEITANMLDEYNMSDTKKPFEITFPTQLSPVMVFKDYGRGLSKEDVFDLYTTYGASTKDTVNSVDGQDIIGGFGIGSKSPFAYTDSFIVESRQNGVLRTYVAMLDDARMPTIVQTSSKQGEKTAEPNGLTVKVAVQQKDIRQCAENMKDILEFFPVQPIIHSAPETWAVKSQNYVIENDKVGFKLSSTDDYYAKARIILGGRSFPIDFNQLGVKYEHRYKGLDIWMPMGSVDVTVSRESLSYDPLTIKNILAKLEEVEIVVQDDAIKVLKKITNKYLRTIEYIKISGQGILSNTSAFRERCDVLDSFRSMMDYKYMDSAYNSNKPMLRKSTNFSPQFRKEAIFIIVDDASCCDIKTKQFIQDNAVDCNNTHVYQIPAQYWPDLYKNLGQPPKSCIHYTSKMTYVKTESGKAGVRGISCYTLSTRDYKNAFDVQNLSNDKHYLLMDNSYVYINNKSYTHSIAARLIPKDVYLVFRTNRGKVVEYGWKEGSSLVTKHCQDFVVKYSEKNMPYELYDLVKIDTKLEQISLLIKEDGFKVSAYNRELVKRTKQLIKYVENTTKTHNIPNHVDFYERRQKTTRLEHSIYETALDFLVTQGETIEVRRSYNEIEKRLERLEKDTLLKQWYSAFPLMDGCDNNVTNTNKVDYLSKWG
jgi:hypothetical protein